MKVPLISIITISLNAGESIRRTLESINSQTFTDYEHFIIDGGSTDNTLSIIQEFYLPRSKVTSEKDNGIADAMNKGIKKSCGELIIHLNAGDELFTSDVLSKVAESYLNFNWDWATGSFQLMEESGRLKCTVIVNGFDYNVLRHFSFINHQSTFVTRRVFDKFGLFDELLLAMDYEFFLRIGHHVEPYVLPFIVAKFWAGGLSERHWFRCIDARRARAKSDPKNPISAFLFETLRLIVINVAWLLNRCHLSTRWRRQLRKVKLLISGNASCVITVVDAK